MGIFLACRGVYVIIWEYLVFVEYMSDFGE